MRNRNLKDVRGLLELHDCKTFESDQLLACAIAEGWRLTDVEQTELLALRTLAEDGEVLFQHKMGKVSMRRRFAKHMSRTHLGQDVCSFRLNGLAFEPQEMKDKATDSCRSGSACRTSRLARYAPTWRAETG
jgi:hypothetical protein